jgi:hypothetical protein
MARSVNRIAVYRDSDWTERGEITLEAAAQIMDVSVMTALRMVRRGIIKGRQLCRGARVYRVCDLGAATKGPSATTSPVLSLLDKPSIAVLP